MEYNITDTCNISIKVPAQDNKKLPYITPTLILLEAQDIASGGPNPGPDGTNGNLS